MKTKNLIRIFIFAVFSLNCKKKIPTTVSEIDKLPEATMTGQRTLGCLVNGNAYTAQSYSSLWGYLNGTGTSYPESGNTITISGSYETEEKHPWQEIRFYINNPQVGSFNMGIGEDPYNVFHDYHGIEYYLYDSLDSKVTLKKFDAATHIVAGTFSATLYDEGHGGMIKITKGRFDLKF